MQGCPPVCFPSSCVQTASALPDNVWLPLMGVARCTELLLNVSVSSVQSQSLPCSQILPYQMPRLQQSELCSTSFACIGKLNLFFPSLFLNVYPCRRPDSSLLAPISFTQYFHIVILYFQLCFHKRSISERFLLACDAAIRFPGCLG